MNSFYDIFGQETTSLSHLVTTKSIKTQANYIEGECPLVQALHLNINNINNQTQKNEETQPTRKRRASATDIQNESGSKLAAKANESESLLVPMEKNRISRLAKINQRRYTCFEERPSFKRPNKPQSPSVSMDAPTLSVSTVQPPKKDNKPAKTDHQSADDVERKVKFLKQLVDTGKFY